MTTTFADYAATAEARNDIAQAVLGHTMALCEALRQNYIDYSIKSHQHAIGNNGIVDESYVPYHEECIAKLRQGICDYDYIIETGRKYHRIVMVIQHDNCKPSRSVHAFVDKKTGEVYKSASWKSPAKGVRFDLRIIEQRKWLLEHADWAGSYLYKR